MSSRRSVLKGFAIGTALSAAMAATLVVAVIRTDQDRRALSDGAFGASALASGPAPHRCADERPAHRETMVQRQARLRAGRRRPDRPGLQADRRAAGLFMDKQGHRRHRLSAPDRCNKYLRRAGGGLRDAAAPRSRRSSKSISGAGTRMASNSGAVSDINTEGLRGLSAKK